MAGLKSILSSKVSYTITENNLEQGVIYAFSPGTFYTNYCNGFCWKPPATGCAIVEIWGAQVDQVLVCVVVVEDCPAMQVDIQEKA
jgi:hypothetical protein